MGSSDRRAHRATAMTVVTVALAACAAWLMVRPAPAGRHVQPNRGVTDRPDKAGQQRSTSRDKVTRSTRMACGAIGVVLALVVGGVLGIAVGVAVGLAGPRVLSRLESRHQRQRRERLERQAPAVADLMASCLAAGATPRDAVAAVARAVGEPVATPLMRLCAALDLGADPVSAWRALMVDPSLQPLARAGARAAQTGAPLAALLVAVADDQRDEARSRAEAAARAAGVRSVAPLVACFLPAFILIGIIPIVASLALPYLQ